MTTTVRRMVPDDHRVLRAVRLRALAEAPDAFGSTLERELAFAEDIWRDRLRPDRNPHFVAERDGDAVGMLAVVVGGSEQEVGQLVAMWVDPAARGDGVADALVQATVDCARDMGCSEIRLHVADGNDRAERFYRRVGFARTGTTYPNDDRALVEVEMAMVVPERQSSLRTDV